MSLDSTMHPNPAENLYWNNYNRNDGRAGVVYILENDAFPHLLKIGQSTRSAAARAQELNDSCGTESPGRFSVLHEVRTVDCGRAEKRVHKQLKKYRFRKEYFKIEVVPALSEVQAACAFFDKKEEEKKRVADDARRTAAESATQSEQQEGTRKLSPSEEAAIYVGLSDTERHHKAKAADEGRQQKPKTAPVKPSSPEPSANRTAGKPESHSDDYAIVTCPSCRQNLRVPTREDLILTCPTCRYSFQRTSSGQIFSHNIQNPAPPKTSEPSAPWWAYVLAMLAVGVFFLILTRGSGSSEVTTATPAPSLEERRLLADIGQYVKGYQIPTPDPKGETNLRAVAQAGATIHFTYVTTPNGERALSKNFDWPYIKESMRKLACAKPELRALIKRGVVVHYQLQRKNGILVTAIVCE